MNIFGLQLKDNVPLDSLYGLMNSDLLLLALLSGVMVHCSWSLGLRIFRTFQTEVCLDLCELYNDT